MANKHYHKYRLKDLARKRDVPPYHVYICIKQDCSHHIRVELIDGKISECNRCGEPFLMKLAKLKHGDRIIVKPHCDDCTKTPLRVKQKKEKLGNSIDELMESILPKAING
jgi:formylmethanofuran dehydrogenase subunit E